MKTISNAVLIALTSLIFICCKERHSLYSGLSRDNKNDSFKESIPLEKNGDTAFFYKIVDETEKKFGLETLKKGYNQLQIRIWYGYAKFDSSQLVVIKKTDNKWSADLYTFKIHEDTWPNDTIISIGKVGKTAVPSSGWEHLVNSLEDLGIMTLPHYKLIPGYDDSDSDQSGVTVQVANSELHRMYHYPDPGHHAKDIDQAKKMEKILRLIEQEFKFPRLNKN